MTEEYSINVTNVSKSFKVKNSSTVRKSNNIKHVLKNVSFSIRPGEVVGIIGGNGAGKSTLLSILSKIYKPTDGQIEINGTLASILELGLGFNKELSGRENIFLTGETHGISRSKMNNQIDSIVRYAKLEEFIEAPIKTYSSGMTARLAFSTIVHIDADILLFDEVLSVGDVTFASKAKQFFKESIKKGKTILFVSHSLTDIQEMCTRAIWLKNGEIKEDGNPRSVCNHYYLDSTQSYESLIELAELNVPSAQYDLAKYYQKTNTIENYQLYLEWIKKAADNGDPNALYEWGNVLLERSENEEAIRCFQLSANSGNDNSRLKLANIFAPKPNSMDEQLLTTANCMNLSLLHNYATSILLSDSEKSFNLLTSLADGGYCPSQLFLGELYLDGKLLVKDIEKSIFYLEKAANQWDIRAIHRLIQLYSEGIEVEYNCNKIREYCLKGSEIGDASSQYKMAEFALIDEKTESDHNHEYAKWMELYNTSISVQYHLQRFSSMSSDVGLNVKINLLDKLIDAGCIEALYQKGVLLHDSDFAGTIKCYKKAAEYGHTLAMSAYTDLVVNKKIEAEYVNAFNCCKKLTTMGDVNGEIKAGLMYRSGMGTVKDINLAVAYLEDAAKTDNMWALMELYATYFERRDEHDLERAFDIARSHSDNIGFKTRLGVSYRDGIGTERNAYRAVQLLCESAELGDAWAISELESKHI